MNVNWWSDDVPCLQTFHFCVSIALEFNISDMFEVQSKTSFQKQSQLSDTKSQNFKIEAGTEYDKMDETYMLKAVVCFVGAHYMSFVKSQQDKRIVWKLYDDANPILKFDTWE